MGRQITIARQHREGFVDALSKAFNNFELRELVLALGEKVAYDIIEERQVRANVSGLFEYVNRRGCLELLVVATKSERPDHQQIQDVCVNLLKVIKAQAEHFIESDKPGRGVDHCESILLRNRAPFIDREEVRKLLREMRADDGPRILRIEGPPKAGKSYCVEFVLYVLSRQWPNDCSTVVDLSEIRGATVDDITAQIEEDFELQGMPTPIWGAQYATENKFVRKLCDRSLIGPLKRKQNACSWLILDGIRELDANPPIQQFLSYFLVRCREMDGLRVVMLDYELGVPRAATVLERRVAIDYLSENDIMAFFDAFVIKFGIAFSDTENVAQRLTEELLTSLPRRQPDRQLAIGKLLPPLLDRLLATRTPA